MAEYPPLGKSYVSGYANNDRDWPIVSIRKDPRVENYKIPDDLSPHPDSARYPNHVFTGSQPTRSDERVEWVYEILPGPWVPFTRYDDDLGPIQGRRRSVKNEGQIASLGPNLRTTYEARDGSAIVYTEIEESWSAGSAGGGDFPIKDRNIYDERFGAVKETRQLIIADGTESATVEYMAPNIVETSYEAYNEHLSFKIVRTYALSGPVRREDIYDEIRGSVQRVSQLVHDSGNLQGSLVNEGGIITQTVYQPVNTLVVDRIIETYSVNGENLTGGATGQWGVEPSERTLVPSSSEVESGFGIKSSALVPVNKEQSEKRKESYPPDEDGDGIIYTLKGQEQDETSGAIIAVEKSLVDASKVDAGSVAQYLTNLRSQAYTVEVQPVDKWHSITIASKITGAPRNETWTETSQISLPNELLEVGVIWDSKIDSDAGTAGVDNIPAIIAESYSWNVLAEATIIGGVSGRPYTKVRNGYNGPAETTVSRTFFSSAPTQTITVRKFEPAFGYITIFGVNQQRTGTSRVNGVGGTRISSSGSSKFNNDSEMAILDFGPVEHNNPQLQSKGDPATRTDVVSASGGSVPGGGSYPAINLPLTVTGKATLELPPSSTPLTSGQTFIKQVVTRPWRLGWWVREIYTAKVP